MFVLIAFFVSVWNSILAFIMLFPHFDLCDRFFLNMVWDNLLTNGGDVSTQNPPESTIVLIVPKNRNIRNRLW